MNKFINKMLRGENCILYVATFCFWKGFSNGNEVDFFIGATLLIVFLATSAICEAIRELKG